MRAQVEGKAGAAQGVWRHVIRMKSESVLVRLQNYYGTIPAAAGFGTYFSDVKTWKE